MTEPTSIYEYREAHESGLIGQRQMQVLEFVIANEPCSQGDVSRHFADASSSFQPRFRELEDSGCASLADVERLSAQKDDRAPIPRNPVSVRDEQRMKNRADPARERMRQRGVYPPTAEEPGAAT